MIRPQRHLPPSSRLYRGCRYNLIHCSVGGADTIMQHVGTGVITVFPESKIKKDKHKKKKRKQGEKDGVMMMGRPKLTIKTSKSDVSEPLVDLSSYTCNTSSSVYLPWLPVIIFNISFS